MSVRESIEPRDSQALRDLVRATQPERIVEFGSWHGRSALAFLLEAKKTNPEVMITCVDTWLGSPEHWDARNLSGEWSFDNLLLSDGEPTFIEVFREGMSHHGLSSNSQILRCPSAFSESYLRKNFYDPDLFYIDADHSTKAVISDISIAHRLSPTGLISGDDWCWPSVQRAVLKVALELGAEIIVADDDFAWALGRRHNTVEITALKEKGWKKRPKIAVLMFLAAHLLTKPLRRLSR